MKMEKVYHDYIESTICIVNKKTQTIPLHIPL